MYVCRQYMLYTVGMFMIKVKQDELVIVEISKTLILCEPLDSFHKCTFFLHSYTGLSLQWML